MKKKLNLKQLSVTSFITTVKRTDVFTIKGGVGDVTNNDGDMLPETYGNACGTFSVVQCVPDTSDTIGSIGSHSIDSMTYTT